MNRINRRNRPVPAGAFCIAAVCLTGWMAGRNSAAAAPETLRRDAVVRAVEMAMPSVLNIATEELVSTGDPLDNLFREFFGPYYRQRPPNTQFSLGSGVIIDEEGYIITNYHVVARARRVWVRLSDGRELEAEKISGTPATDLALLRIKSEKEEKFTAVRFAADDDLMLGETVLALGNPFGLGGSVSRGILSSKSRRPPREGETMDVMDWLQTDAAINPGNSGGPLINLNGELIGINIAIYREGQGIGFAVPIKRLAASISEIYSPESLDELWFGARIRPAALPLEVVSVEKDSPAAQAGLQTGDTILEINGQTPKGYFHFHRQVLMAGDKQEIKLRLERQSQRLELTLRLVPLSTFFNESLIRKKTGGSVPELTPDLARVLGLGRIQGMLVAGVERNSAAAAVGLDQGMVITHVAGQHVVKIVDAARILHGKKSGEKVLMDVVVPRQRGLFYLLEKVSVELQLH